MAEPRAVSVRSLSAGRIAQAYPLAQLALGNCTPDAWDSYARCHLLDDPERGVLAALDGAGTIFGLLVYQLATPAGDAARRRFQAKTVIATAPFAGRRADVAALLIEAAEREAGARTCERAEIYLPVERGRREADWWAALLEHRGYSPAGGYFFKPLRAGPRPVTAAQPPARVSIS